MLKPSATKQPKRILIVDDQPAITNLWRVMLEKTGAYVVQEENDSQAAVETARRFHPHLIVLDIDMPVVNGPEIARLLRREAQFDRTPIVFLSSLISARDLAAGKRVESHLCLPKPTCVLALVQTIEEAIAHAARTSRPRRGTTTRITRRVRPPKTLCLDKLLG